MNIRQTVKQALAIPVAIVAIPVFGLVFLGWLIFDPKTEFNLDHKAR